MHIEYIWLSILLITFLLSIKDTTYGCCLLMLTRVLIPDVVRLTPFVDISLNTGVIGIIALFIFRDLLINNKLTYLFRNEYFRSLIVFSLLLIITIIFGDCIDYDAQISYYKQYFITDIFPIIALLWVTKERNNSKMLIYSMLFAILINTIYGIITVIIGMNPYASFIDFMYSTKQEQIQDLMLATRAGSITTSSTFSQPNQWGTFLPMAFVFCFYCYQETGRKIYLSALLLTSICVILCGKRTAILSYIIVLLSYFFMMSKADKIKYVIISVMALFLFILVIYIIPTFSSIKDLVETSLFFWDDNLRDKADVGGSSMEMRLEQTFFPWSFISDNLLFGKGFGFTHVYLSEYGLHSVMKGFETILAYAVCNGGVIGVLTWIFLFSQSYGYIRSKCKKNKMYAKLFSISVVVIAIANGLALIIFYGCFVVLLSEVHLLNNNYDTKKKNINNYGMLQCCKRIRKDDTIC